MQKGGVGFGKSGLAHLAVRAALVHSQPLVKALGMLGVLAREHAQLVVLLELLLADRALRERASTRQQQSEGTPMWQELARIPWCPCSRSSHST